MEKKVLQKSRISETSFSVPVPTSVRRKHVRQGVRCAKSDTIQPLKNCANYSFTAV